MMTRQPHSSSVMHSPSHKKKPLSHRHLHEKTKRVVNQGLDPAFGQGAPECKGGVG